jgi:hypothetical protein
VYVYDIDMCCILQGNKRGCDFNELIYDTMSHWPDDLKILLSLDSDDLPCHYASDSLCQCGLPARQGVIPSKLGYGFFCDNVTHVIPLVQSHITFNIHGYPDSSNQIIKRWSFQKGKHLTSHGN